MRVSILVGSVGGGGCLSRLLRSLGPLDAAVVVADRVGEDPRLGRRLLGDRLRWVTAPHRAPLARLRRLALDAADSEVVVVVEDHAIAPAGWLDRLLAPLDAAGTVASAGPVRRVSASASDEAAFACDYAPFTGPRRPPRLPGMNTAYRAAPLRAALQAVHGDDLWERDAHDALAAEGSLAWAPTAVLHHDARASWPRAFEQRYVQGRLHPRSRRGALVTPALPSLLAARTLAALPQGRARIAGRVGLLHTAGALGELVGALAGPGDAAERLR